MAAAAATFDGGKGLFLRNVNPDDNDDMNEVCAALKVRNIGAKTRLEGCIQSLLGGASTQPAPMDQQQVVASNSRAINEGWSQDLSTLNPPSTEVELRNAAQAGLANALPLVEAVWAEGPDQPVSDVIREESVASVDLSPEFENLVGRQAKEREKLSCFELI